MLTETESPFVKALREYHWGELGIETSSEANRLGREEAARRQQQQKVMTRKIVKREDVYPLMNSYRPSEFADHDKPARQRGDMTILALKVAGAVIAGTFIFNLCRDILERISWLLN